MDIGRPEIFFVAFVGFLILLFMVIARISGWTTLATFYRLSGPFNGECWRFQSAQMRWKMGYNNCLTIGADESGLYLSIFFLFRLGHPNLFIPWGDISIRKKKGFLYSCMELRFQQAPTIAFLVNERLEKQIEKAAGNAWPGERRKEEKDGYQFSHP
jgi:hypothetical protein